MKRFYGLLALLPGLALAAGLSVTPPPVTPPSITPPAFAVTPPPIMAQPAVVNPAPVQPPAVVVTDAQMVTALVADGYTVTPPAPPITGPVALAWPFTVRVSVAYTPPAGKTVASYTAKGNSNASFMTATSSNPVFMAQGVNGSWAGGPMSLAVTATFTDGTTAALGSTNLVALQATNGSIIPTSGNVYVGGEFYWKGDFNNNLSADYAVSRNGQTVLGLSSQNNVGGIYQPYAPVTSSTGFDVSKFSYLNITVEPTMANKTWLLYFEADNDVADGVSVTIGNNAAFGPTAITPGKTYTYKIPVSAFKLANVQVLKYAFNDGTNVPTGSVSYVYDMHFSTN